MPPPGSGVPPLTIDEKMTIARWIDLDAPINAGDGGVTTYGWFLDEIRPTLEVSLPRAGTTPGPLAMIRIGVADAHGVAPGSLSVTADFPVAGRAAGAELADLATPAGDGIHVIAVDPPLGIGGSGRVHAKVADLQGNVTRVDRRFSVVDAPPPGSPPACPPSPTASCAVAAKASFRVRAKRLAWQWTGSDAGSHDDLGDPVAGTTGYALCVYDAAGTLRTGLGVPAAGRCGARPCWRAVGSGYRYADRRAGHDGVVGVALRAGAGRRARLKLKARGPALPMPALPLGGGATVELRRSDAASCWRARFDEPAADGPTRFRAATPTRDTSRVGTGRERVALGGSRDRHAAAGKAGAAERVRPTCSHC